MASGADKGSRIPVLESVLPIARSTLPSEIIAGLTLAALAIPEFAERYADLSERDCQRFKEAVRGSERSPTAAQDCTEATCARSSQS